MLGELTDHDAVRAVEVDLRREFHGLLPEDVIADLAAQEVAVFRAAPVRAFVSVLAWRRARERATRLAHPEGLRASSG